MIGAIRFGFFAAVIVAIGLGVYANSLSTKLENANAAIATIAADRDSWKTKFDQQQVKSTADATALEQANSQVKDLQAKLEEAQKPPQRVRRR